MREGCRVSCLLVFLALLAMTPSSLSFRLRHSVPKPSPSWARVSRSESRATPAPSEITTTRPVAGHHLLDIAEGLFEEVIIGCEHDDRHILVNERNGPMLHLA